MVSNLAKKIISPELHKHVWYNLQRAMPYCINAICYALLPPDRQGCFLHTTNTAIRAFQMKTSYPSLDGLRGIAALFVCVLHVSVWGSGPQWDIHIGRSVLAVDLFFAMSGFVIASSYEHRLADGSMSTKGFVLTRMARLYPLYALSLTLALFVHQDAVLEQVAVDRLLIVVASFMCFPWKLGDSTLFFPFNIACWSLFFELLVNFLYVVGRKWLTDRVLLAMVGFFAVLLAVLVHFHGMDMGPYWSATGLLGGLVRALFGTALGVWLFRSKGRIPKWTTGGGGYWLPLVVVSLVFAVPPIAHMENRLMLGAVLFVLPWCLLYAVRGETPSGRMKVVFAFLGSISYPIYLLHLPLWLLVSHFFSMEIRALGPFLGLVVFLSAMIALATFVERHVERPIRRWLANRLVGPSAMPAT